jgi:hypothetical protein
MGEAKGPGSIVKWIGKRLPTHGMRSETVKAIVTYYLPATDFKGSRIKAKAEGQSITKGYPHHMNSDDAHRWIAQELANKLGWRGRWIGGTLPTGTETVCVCEGGNEGEFTITEGRN